MGIGGGGSGKGKGKQEEEEGKKKKKRESGQDLYFQNPVWELWVGGGELVGGLSSFVLTWTLFYGLVRS